VSDLESMEKEELVVLAAVATACKRKAYADISEIEEAMKIKSEEYGISIDKKNFEKILQNLIQQDFVYKGNMGYTIIHYPVNLLLSEIEERMRK